MNELKYISVRAMSDGHKNTAQPNILSFHTYSNINYKIALENTHFRVRRA